MITLVLGGARSGKSAVAERLAAKMGPALTYVATAAVPRDDPDFLSRIQRHRDRRPDTWSTVEAGDDLAGELELIEGPVVLDSLGTWVARHRDFVVDVERLCAVLAGRTHDIVIVSEEVGMGVHPETIVGRTFRDALGAVNQAVAVVADEVLLVVAGRVLRCTEL